VRRVRLFWHVYLSVLGVTLLALGAATWLAARSMQESYQENLAQDLEARARLIQELTAGRWARGETAFLDGVCKHAGSETGTRVTLVLADGAVVGVSRESPALMENHRERPEVRAALDSRRPAVAQRFSDTLGEHELYVAVPVWEGERVVGVVRTALPLAAVRQHLRGLYAKVALGGVAAAVLAALLSLFVSRRISRPLEEMKAGAGHFARGELSARLAVPDVDEVGGLAETMNQMAAQLDERMRTVLRQRNELEAVLSSMVEGVLAIDPEERLLSVNAAASRLFGVQAGQAAGRAIQEVIRHPDLQRFVARALASTAAIAEELNFRNGGERFLEAHGTPLRDARGASIGVLVVLHDVTHLRRLEAVRRDFVANVSHELKTPITSIQGFLESLLEGGLEDPVQARRFLEIVARQSNRLNAIVEDLLTLSQLEQPDAEAHIHLEEAPVRPVLAEAIRVCSRQAQDKHIRVDLACPEDLKVPMNAPLLEQAVVNLIDNAIKFSEPGSRVQVEAAAQAREAWICVRDEGCGISGEHLPRLFERFYRVDRARSRKAGGTGLGLAITKHIVLVHRGRVTVESTPGKGSTFGLCLRLS